MDFLIIEADFPFWRGFVFEQWKRLPHRTLLLSRAPALWRHADWDAVLPLPLRDGALDVAALSRIARDFGDPAGACTMFEPAVGQTLAIQRALGLPPLSDLEPRALRNKAAMVETMAAAGLAVPRTVYGHDAATLVARSEEVGAFPLVVKPSELAGKAGVSLVRDPAALPAAIAAALAETLPFVIDGVAASVVDLFGCDRGALVQEYVDGPEYSIEGYAARGRIEILAVTEKVHSGPPLFEELGHLQPARLAPDEERAVRDYAVAAARAFRLRHTFFHLEVRLDRRGPVMMEINCRLGGDMIARLLELRSGMNTGDLLLRIAAGEDVPPPPRFTGAAGVRMATVDRGGRVSRLLAPVLTSDREHAVFEARPGATLPPPKPGGVTRVGYYLAAAPTVDEVTTALDRLQAGTTVEIEPE